MAPLYTLLAFLVLLFSAEAQQDGRAAGSTKVLEPWLVGLTAVVVFLFIVFSLMIVNRLWCKKNKRDAVPEPCSLEPNFYDNKAIELEDGQRIDSESGVEGEKRRNVPETVGWEQKQTSEGDKITTM